MTRSLTHLIYLIHGSDFWTIFSLFGPEVQINWKYLLIISIIYIPPLNSVVRIPSQTFHSLMWWSHLRMVSYKPTFTLNPLTNINVYLSPHATCPPPPPHTKRSIPYSLALRLRRICSDNDTYKQRCEDHMDYLLNRGYKLIFLKTQIRHASDISRNAALQPKPKQQKDTVPFVITYNPALLNIPCIIHKHSNVLYWSGRGKNFFPNLPLVA